MRGFDTSDYDLSLNSHKNTSASNRQKILNIPIWPGPKNNFLKKKRERNNITTFNFRKQVEMPIVTTWLNTHVLLFNNFVKESRGRVSSSPISQNALTMKYLDNEAQNDDD